MRKITVLFFAITLLSVYSYGQTISEHIINSDAYENYVKSVDLDGDGDIDIVTCSYNDNRIAWYENLGNQNFTEHIIINTDIPRVIYPDDVDNDGDIDILFVSYSNNKVAWCKNDGNQNFTEQVISITANGAIDVYSIDIDNDGDNDVLSALFSENKIAWYENDGSENFTEHLITTTSMELWSVYAIDIDNDTDIDIISGSSIDEKVTWHENDGMENFTEHLISNHGGNSIHANDINGNGKIDVISGGHQSSYLSWFSNDGTGIFTENTINTTAVGGLFSVDIDGDGDIDVISSEGSIIWYENNGSGAFTAHTIGSGSVVDANDFDNDGDMEIISEYGGNIVWYEICFTNDEVYLTNLAFYDQSVVDGNDMNSYYGLPNTMNYNSSNQLNLINAGENVRFKIECENKLTTGQSIVFGECTIITNDPYITINDGTSGLNNIAWGSKAWSTDEFEIYIDPNTPNGHTVIFDFIVEENGKTYRTSCIPVLVNPLVCTGSNYIIDDDANPDSNGDDDGIVENGETIEFLPYLDNISEYNAEITQGQFFNLNDYQNITVWDSVQGLSGTVYDWSWWNYSFGTPSVIAAGETNMQPQFDFVFDYNADETYKFTLHTIFSGGFYLFEGSSDLTLLRFATPITFNEGYPNHPNDVSVTEILDNNLINIHPNPAKNQLTISSEQLVVENIEILDITGKTVKQLVINKEQVTINIADLQNGIYILKAKTKQGVIVKRFVKID